MSRKKANHLGKVVFLLICMICLIGVKINIYRVAKSAEEKLEKYEERIITCEKEIISYEDEVIKLKEEIAKKDEIIVQQKEIIKGGQVDYSEMDNYLTYKFQPDGQIYDVNAANVAFYPNPDLTGRISYMFEFISDVVDPLESYQEGKTIYCYLTTKGVIYSDERVFLYAREN